MLWARSLVCRVYLSRQGTLLHLAMPMRCVLRVECDRMCSILSACVAFTDGCAAPALRRVRHYLLRAAYVRTQRGLGAALVDRSRWRVFPCSFRIGIVYVADGQTTEEVPWRGVRVECVWSARAALAERSTPQQQFSCNGASCRNGWKRFDLI